MADYKKLEQAENINLSKPNTYADQLDVAVANTGKPYKYDFNADQLYQDYKKNYMTEAQKARANVINAGKQYTAAHPDTYVDSAANQQYQTYMAEINRLAPTFENLAWAQHQMENDDALKQANMLAGLSDTEYGRYRDALGDLYNNRKYELGNFKYDVGLENEQKAFANKVDSANKEYEQQLYLDRIKEAEEAKAAAEAAAAAARARSGGGGGRRGGGGGGNGYYSQSGQQDYIVNATGANIKGGKTPMNGYGGWVGIAGANGTSLPRRASLQEINLYVQQGKVQEYVSADGGHYFKATPKKSQPITHRYTGAQR